MKDWSELLVTGTIFQPTILKNATSQMRTWDKQNRCEEIVKALNGLLVDTIKRIQAEPKEDTETDKTSKSAFTIDLSDV